METWFQDVRYALRSLRRNPGFTLIAAATLALGIGANTGIFSVVNAVLLRALPYDEPDRLVKVFAQGREVGSRFSLSYPDLLDVQGLTRDFSGIAPYTSQRYNFTSGGEPHEVRATLATDDLFRVLRAEPLVGRTFAPNELREQVVILGHGLWSSEFGSDRDVIGRAITLDGRSFTVVGVMPAGFRFPDEDVRIWVPLGQYLLTHPEAETNRHFGAFNAVARLAPGATVEQATADLAVVAQRIDAAERDRGEQRLEISLSGARGPGGAPRTSIIPETQFQVVPLLDDVLQDKPRALWVLFGAVGMVLLIACANVAALLVARGAARRKEIAVRQAMGAGRWPIARQLLTESTVLAVLGGAVGMGISYWGVSPVLALWPDVLPRAQEINLDLKVLAFALGLSVLTGLVAGVIPALRASVVGVEQTLRDESGATGARSRRRINSALVVAELAVALVLLVGSGLLIRSFFRLTSVEPGYDTRDVLAARVRLTPSRYATTQAQTDFFQRLTEQLAQNPGVAQMSLSRSMPLTGEVDILAFDPRTIRADYPEPFLASRMSVVAPGYFAALGIPLRLGRDFTPSDRADAPPVAVINTQLADLLWPGQSPLGRTIPVGVPGREARQLSVIGVIGDVRYASLDAPVMPELYLPYLQWEGPPGAAQMWVTLRARTSPLQLAGALRDAVRQLDQEQPIGEIASLNQILSRSTATRRFNMTLLSSFAGLALMLALVGIYGITAYAVTQRSREMGLRMAIGARPAEVVRLLLEENLWLVLGGLAAGVAGAAAGTRVLKSLVFEVSTTDLATFLGAALVLGTVAMVATYLPARRAAKVDPMEALRYE